jgi:hypothetical protein
MRPLTCGKAMASGERVLSRKEVVKVQAIVVSGRRPDMKLCRDGEHGNCVYARVNVTPRRARPSSVGVIAWVL